jgi:NADH-ubiquinone oxidoreductase chain 2
MLLFSLNLLLLSNAVTTRRDKSILFSRTAIFIFVYCCILLIYTLDINFLEKAMSLLGGLLFCKYHVQIFIIFLFFLVIMILTLTSYYPRKILFEKHDESVEYEHKSQQNLEMEVVNYAYNGEKDNYISKILNKKGEQFGLIEYPLIILFVVLGAVFLMSSNDIITIFLSIELQSYGLYIICTLYRDSELSTNAGLTYFLLGGLSSCIILLGQSLLYMYIGNTNLDSFYLIEDIYGSIFYLNA